MAMNLTGATVQKGSSFVGVKRSLRRKMQRLKDGWITRKTPDKKSHYLGIENKTARARVRRKVRRKTLQSMRR